ncbi:hypothetical protein KPZU09_21560 [Klebsiella pneumoniae]|uniref:Uncharacterized protein n=1 Tax=Klebsiella pneumoniae TaxID=573 RepID=A0A919LU85_KLEPN|nr:hypothetical protein KPZU09_21560 [Klebsiella pneumoniae]
MQTFTYSLKPALASGELVEILSARRPAPILFPAPARCLYARLAAVFPAAVQG